MSRASSARSVIAVHKRVWRMEPQEEFIWAMRLHRATEDTSDDSTTESEEEIVQEIREKSTSGSLLDYYSEKILRQVQLFSSFLPDAALANLDDYDPKEIECCLLYGRITGLHQLIDKYHNMKADFKVKLTTQLNEFFGAIVQEILLNGGDIVKFSPTTIVAIWKCSRMSTMTQNVHVALDCTLVIRKSLTKFALEAAEKVSIEFAITAGSLNFSLIGDDSFSSYLICGALYEDVRKARKEITVNNIIVAPNAIQFIHSFEYEIDQVEGYAFYQVIGLTAMWKQVRRADYQEVELEARGAPSLSTVSLQGRGSLATAGSTNEFYLRPILVGVVDNPENFLEKIFKFCQKGIKAGILEDQPVDNFVELRFVSIVSMKVETSISKTDFMLKLTNKIYKVVSRFAAKYLGFTDYVTTHDNKAFLAVTFGLRNCSHVMQQRSALKCAHKIMASIKIIDKINTVSIGVSTGKVYYTMIGHPLRQELTMFGKMVNSAANLASAFNGRIVCDQDTFLHSKMDADCFNLISKEQMHVVEEIPSTCIYELMSDEPPQPDEIPVYDHPTIGREKEISIFTGLLDKFVQSSPTKRGDPGLHSVLFIRAYPKEGKTRLLHELIRLTPRTVPVHYIPLDHGNEDMPFFFIRKFFRLQFGDLLLLKPKEREVLLLASLKLFPKLNLIWALNPVFKVNFSEPKDLQKYSIDKRLEIISEILTYLYSKDFPKMWCLAVDDIDYLDEHSCNLLENLHRTNTFFLVLTSNRDLSLRMSRRSIFSGNPKVMKIKIDALSPNYFGAIACQHFHVYAISSDLEYILQKKSYGNIGYIKNLLTILYHGGFIYVREVTLVEASEENLVPQSVLLVIPMPESRKKRLLSLILKKGKYDTNEFKRVLWYLFVESMQGRKFYDFREKIYRAVIKSDKIKACFLKKILIMSSMPDDLTISIRITQIFEMLTYPEQMILKCCSVLGDCFSRMVLEHVLTLDYYTLLAPAVQSFFEMSILCCGRGDFTEGAQFTVIREKCVDPQFDEDLSCKCRAIFQERFRNIPDYAYCGFLRFKYPRFREIIYEQLRQSQKIDCHAKVIIFLHEETKRCRSCGRDAFNWDTKKRLDDYNEDLKKEWLGRKKAKRAEREFDSLRTPMHELFYEDKLPSSSMHKYSSIKTSSYLSLDLSIRGGDMEPTATELDVYSIRKVFGPMLILKASTNASMVRTFAAIDFTYCDCVQILSAYFRDMIIHCKGAGQHTKLYDNMQKYAYLCIYNKNISEAQNILKRAKPCINDIFEMKKAPPAWKKKLYEGKLSTISALAYTELGLYDDAIVDVQIALKKFEITWPKNKIRKSLNLATERIRRFLTFFAFPEMHTKSLSTCICEYYVDVAEALNLYGKLLMKKKKWKSAELASSWALYKSLSAQTDFSIICECFSNMIMIAIHNKNLYMCEALQVHALRFCYRKTNRVESWELAAVCRMYLSVLIVKFIRCQIEFGIHLGYIIIKIGACLNDNPTLLIVSTYLMALLMSKLYLQEASSLLLEMEYCSEEIDDVKAQLWFHCQALSFHIETGYCIVPYQQCVNIFDINTNINEESDFIDSYRRFGILMWLWYLRNEQWESASHFNEFIEASSSHDVGRGTIRSVISQLYILEGLLLLFVDKLNKGNIWESKKLDKSVRNLMRILFKESKFVNSLIPRLFFLRTYYYHIKNNEKKYQKWIAKTKKAAEKTGSELIVEWTNHVRAAWKKDMPKKKKNFWRDHCEENNLFFFQQFDSGSDEIGYFTLPTPMYV